jgi:hypothetical protein
MDRTGWIIVILCVLGLAAWQIFYAPQMVPTQPVEAPEEQAAPATEPGETTEDAPPEETATAQAPTEPGTPRETGESEAAAAPTPAPAPRPNLPE